VSMARAIAVAAAFFVAACGAVPGSQGKLPAPSPPTAALAKWSNFPADARPRPIIWFGDVAEKIGEGQFRTEAAKIAWGCRKFVPAPGLTLTADGAAAGSARWPSGVSAAYPATIGSRSALSAMSFRPAPNTACAAVKPLTIAAARLDDATFSTDRGSADITSWVFDVPEVEGSIAYPALDPSAFWKGGVTVSQTSLGAKVSADGKTLTITVVGGPERGVCGVDYAAALAESKTAVAVALHGYPHDPNAVCDMVGYGRTVTVVLKSPLGNRVLLDEGGNVGTAAP